MKARTWPIVEVFGPTIQGEGPDAGRPCWFVRVGGCDFRCSWCDSMHAVTPALVRRAPRLTVQDITSRLSDLGAWRDLTASPYIVLSGGNPALHHMADLVDELHALGATIAVETQGTIYRDWLDDIDRLIVSPKPPSSGMAAMTESRFPAFMGRAHAPAFRCGDNPGLAIKIVVADDVDYQWARGIHAKWHHVPFYLSVCTPQHEGLEHEAVARNVVGRGYRWLAERVANDAAMNDAVVLPQLHVIAWGTRAGV